MSCYLRHMKDIFSEAGIQISYNKKDIDRIIHSIVGIPYKDCSAVWKKVKDIIKGDNLLAKGQFVDTLKQKLNKK